MAPRNLPPTRQYAEQARPASLRRARQRDGERVDRTMHTQPAWAGQFGAGPSQPRHGGVLGAWHSWFDLLVASLRRATTVAIEPRRPGDDCAAAYDQPALPDETPPSSSEIFFDHLVDQMDPHSPKHNPTTRQAQIFAGRWLALRRLRLGLASNDLSRQAGLPSSALMLLESGLGDPDLAPESGWHGYAKALARPDLTEGQVAAVVAVALGRSEALDHPMIDRVRSELGLETMADHCYDYLIMPIATASTRARNLALGGGETVHLSGLLLALCIALALSMLILLRLLASEPAQPAPVSDLPTHRLPYTLMLSQAVDWRPAPGRGIPEHSAGQQEGGPILIALLGAQPASYRGAETIERWRRLATVGGAKMLGEPILGGQLYTQLPIRPRLSQPTAVHKGGHNGTINSLRCSRTAAARRTIKDVRRKYSSLPAPAGDVARRSSAGKLSRVARTVA